MKKGSNEVEKEGELAIGGGMSSLRRRFLKGKVRNIKYNFIQKQSAGNEDTSKVAGGKVITIKKEIRTETSSGSGTGASGEGTTKLKTIKVSGAGRDSNSAGKLAISRQNRESKNESGGKNSESKKNTITKIEIKNDSKMGRNKSVANTNSNQKGGNVSRTTKTTETTTTTTTKSQKTQGLRAGNQKNQGNEAGRGRSTQSQTTTTKTTTTIKQDNSGRGGNSRKQMTTSQSVVTKNNAVANKNITTTNQRSLISQKSTPALRGNKELNKPKDDKKRPLSSIPQELEMRDNISRITIDDTGKHPKKEYVLNVRKTDIIKRKNRMRMIYTNDPNAKKILTTDFNHNIKVVKNVSKDLPTVDSLPPGTKIIHRYNYSYNPNIANTSRHEIDETGKIPKKEVVVSPRKISIIKTERKPLKMSIENYNSSSSSKGMKIIPIPNKISERSTSNFRGKNEKAQSSKKETTESRRTNVKTDTKGGQTTTKTTTTKTTRNKSDAGNRNKGSETTTTTKTKITETRTTRGKTEGGNLRGKSGETKVTITKTTETKAGKSGSGSQLQITRNASGKADDKNSRGNRNKIQSVKTSELAVNETGKNKRNKSEAGDKNTGKITKISITKTTEASGNGGSGSRLRGGKGNQSESKTETKVTTTTTKTTTKTTTSKIETSEGGDGNVSKIRKFKSHRNLKK